MMRDGTIISAAERAEAEDYQYTRNSSSYDWIGRDSLFCERMLFDFAKIRASARRNNDADVLALAEAGVARWSIEKQVRS